MKRNQSVTPIAFPGRSGAIVLPVLALGLLSVWMGVPAFAQGPPMFFYDNDSSGVYAVRTSGISDEAYTDSGFNVADDQPTRWGTLLDSGYARGGSAIVRAQDPLEDWEINWTTPTLEGTAVNGRWTVIDFDLNSGNQFNVALNTAATGPQSTQPFRGNPNIIAMDSEGAVFYDSDGTLSWYNQVNGGLAADWTWTNLSGAGTLGTSNTALSSTLFQNQLIGSEELWMAFLTGPSEVEYYNITNGAYIRTTDYSTATTGPLATNTLADVIDGNAPGFRYVGLDYGPVIMGGVVPEPSSALLSLGAVGALSLRRRRRC